MFESVAQNVGSLVGLTTYFVSLIAYGMVVFTILTRLLPRIWTGQKMDLSQVLAPFVQLLVIVTLLQFSPSWIADAAIDGYDAAMPKFMEFSERVVEDLYKSRGRGDQYDSPASGFTFESQDIVTPTPSPTPDPNIGGGIPDPLVAPPTPDYGGSP